MKDKKLKGNLIEILTKTALIVATLILVVYLLTVVSGSETYFRESAEKNALLSLETDLNYASALADVHYQNLYEIAAKVEYAKSAKEVEDIISSYIGSEQFGNLRYYSQGKSYDANGAPVDIEMSANEEISALSKSMTEGCIGSYTDVMFKVQCMAFFVPVRGSAYVDGVLSIVPARNIIDLDDGLQDNSDVMVLIDSSGKVFADVMRPEFEITVGNNFYDFLDTLTSNKEDANRLNVAISSHKKGVLSLSFGSTEYTLAYSPVERLGNHYTLVTMSVSNGLIAPELTYVRHIVNLLFISILALAVGFIFALLYHRQSKQALNAATLLDPNLDCPNFEQFRRDVQELAVTSRRKYSISVFSITNIRYVEEQLGDKDMNEILRFIAKTFEKFTGEGESYAYLGDGRFAILMLNPTPQSGKSKIHLLKTVSNRHELLVPRGIRLRYNVGVYRIWENRGRSTQQMIECAIMAAESTELNINKPYNLFTEEVNNEIVRNERIEAIMESALKNREFKVFVQPKYNVAKDRIDSVEALVRWFDPRKGDYMFPGEFIPLFETNGFITKLDHFVYIEMLEFISHAVERGETVVPVSVNVSRVTATQDDFINFYVSNKKKYRIPDGFITLELTESFAMEDYDKMQSMIEQLHTAGMQCSIDDFGSGYSSFSTLKRMTMDELKLDAVFTRRSHSPENDDLLLSTMIKLAKDLGMKVVQEGVETKEVFDKVVSMGCDVIQGYYYAKAISLEEFKIFVNSNTSIKYKSKVK